MKTFETYLSENSVCEGKSLSAPKKLIANGKHKPGTVMAVVSHPNDPDGKYHVSFQPDGNPLGRTKHVTVGSHFETPEQAKIFSKAYAAHHGVASIDA